MLEQLWSKFQVFSDDQRLERLRACEDLTKCVLNCREVRELRLLGRDELELLNMESCVPGIRMVKYFDWRESKPTRIKIDSGEIHEQFSVVAKNSPLDEMEDKKEIPTCARETHCMWGCRAVALGCSEHIIDLRQCFRKSHTKEQVLNIAKFSYEGDLNGSSGTTNSEVETIPCREIQQILGKCVAEKAAILQQRIDTKINES
mmetsp:Transcript_34337/g.39118  ORF Transcript_34337/g.39118 Transcript_34337/m.39118 type:complete len:203 (-) Transcript_34337:306-914(-)